MYTLKVKVYTNDGDYVTEESVVSADELKKIKGIYTVIKKGMYWGTGDHRDTACAISTGLSEDDREWFDQYTPYGEYGIYSIESVVFAPEITWEKL